jgi:broad specificity phosphatase PhoE
MGGFVTHDRRSVPGGPRSRVRQVPIFLVRHAHAGSRTQWDGDDRLRPLSAKGRRQTDHLLALLADRDHGPVYSSPSRRCIETVEPVAQRAGRAVEIADELDEGNPGTVAAAFLLAHAAENPVACSHGDVIPRVLQRLHATGMRADTDTFAAKGSVWVLDVDPAGKVVRGTYHPAAE